MPLKGKIGSLQIFFIGRMPGDRNLLSPGSTLVLRLYQETIHDFILLFMPPCGPHLTPLATGSLERSLLVFSTPGGLTGNDLSRLFFTCTNTSQAATRTCNT
jgi:hypothetical protein